jgi:hypothetical protein
VVLDYSRNADPMAVSGTRTVFAQQLVRAHHCNKLAKSGTFQCQNKGVQGFW